MHLRTSTTLLFAPALVAACGGGAPPGKNQVARAGTENPAEAAVAPKDPLAEPLDAPLVLEFAYSLGEEIAASQSFESEGANAVYELVLEPSGAAALHSTSERSRAFGPSGAQFRRGAEDAVTREQNGEDRTWLGSFTWSGSSFSVALAEEKASCRTLVAHKGWYAAECAPAPPLSFSCTREIVEVFPPFDDAPSVSARGAAVPTEVFACAPPFGLPAEGDLDVELPDELPFTTAPGLELEYYRRGLHDTDTPKLRRVAEDAPIDTRLD